MRETGTYQIIGNIAHFIPHSLPPANPSFLFSPEIVSLQNEASFALGLLNGMSNRLPDATRFIRAYVIKEALLSSAIEGIHTTLIDVFTHSLEESKPNKDTQLVLNYTHALNSALEMVQQQNFPVANRVILKAHEALMAGGEGERSDPGNFRKQSVRVGNLVPPPAHLVPELMSSLEKYINELSDIPPLLQAGLAHVQFETIHPFLDGNGRIGRLLIVLLLVERGLLHAPILYPSYYFKKHHAEYYERLDRVRTQGDFEGWILYYLKAIRESTQDAYTRALEIESLEKQLIEKINNHVPSTRTRQIASAALNFLFAHPIATTSQMSRELDRAYNTMQNVLGIFSSIGIVSETTAFKRNKQYRFDPYLELLEKEY